MTDEINKPPPRRNTAQRTYTDAERDRGLFALALCSGNARRASDLLAEDGDAIPAPTLQTWKRRRPDAYDRVQQQVYPRIAERMAEEMEDLFTREIELERELVDRVQAELPNLKPSDLSTALRNIAVTKSLNIDKSAPLRGRPNQVIHHDYEGAIGALRRMGLLVEGDAEEIETVELPNPT